MRRELLQRWVLRATVSAVGLALLAVISLHHQRASTARALEENPPPGELVDIGGRQLHLWCAGEGEPVVVLEASGPGTALGYARVLPAVAQRTRVCASDRAGMGFSDPGPMPRTAARVMEDLRAALSLAEVEGPYVLVGASFGGLITRLFALSHPEEVAGMVFLDAVPPRALSAAPGLFASMDRALLGMRLAARFGLLRTLDPFHLKALPPSERGPALAVAYRAEAWAAVSSLVASRVDLLASLAEGRALPAQMPLLVLTHDKAGDLIGPGFEEEARAVEPLWRPLQELLAKESRRGRLRVVEGSGHLIATDRPEAVVEAIDEIVEEVRSNRRGVQPPAPWRRR